MKDVKPGSSFIATSDFTDEFGTPIVLDNPPEYTVRDSSKNLILSGIAEQTTKAERWQALVSIPETVAPGKYFIIWRAFSKENKQINREEFNIIDATPNYYELDLLIPEFTSITDVLKAEGGEVVKPEKVSVISPDGTVIYETKDIEKNSDGSLFQFRSPSLPKLATGASAFALYIINWEFLSNDVSEREHHFVYVVNMKVLAYVNELKRMIDKAGLQNPNPSLRYNNVDLVAYLNLAVNWLNIQPPQQTSFTLGTIPDNIYIYMLYSAAEHALESRYMAEAEAAFNFNGQPIQLEVDRTQFIDSAISRYRERLQNVADIKKGIAMSGGGMGFSSAGGMGNSQGILSLSRGPLTYLSLNPALNSRVADYASILYSLGYNPR